VGFYVHTNMKFIVTERREHGEEAETSYVTGKDGIAFVEAAALPGAPEE